MSIKGRIQTRFATLLTSDSLRNRRRRRVESRRHRRQAPHTVTWYHRAEDPHSYLLAQVLAEFLERYPVKLVCRTIAAPPYSAIPFPEMWASHSLRDCVELARRFGLDMTDTQPDEESVAQANNLLAQAEDGEDYLRLAAELGHALWHGEEIGGERGGQLSQGQLSQGQLSQGRLSQGRLSQGRSGSPDPRLAANLAELNKRGHYSSGMLHYGGEWYWGIDRVPRLEQRLAALGAGKGTTLTLLPQEEPHQTDLLEVFLSVRSPYSYLAVERVITLSKRYDIEVKIRPVLPMAMRGLPVPLKKRLFILSDTAEEARELGIPFGRICDPLGSGVERVLAVLVWALSIGKGEPFLSSATKGIWSEGIEVASDRGLRLVVERAGLSWEEARASLSDESWRGVVEHNRLELEGMGLWGVPSFRLGDYITWGQDRIWLVEEKLRSLR